MKVGSDRAGSLLVFECQFALYSAIEGRNGQPANINQSLYIRLKNISGYFFSFWITESVDEEVLTNEIHINFVGGFADI